MLLVSRPHGYRVRYRDAYLQEACNLVMDRLPYKQSDAAHDVDKYRLPGFLVTLEDK